MGKSFPIQTFPDEIAGWYLLCIYTPTNMYQFTDLHLAISNKLGWGDMLTEIALPAIQQILDNCAKECSMQIEEPVGYETLEDDILRMDGDDLFTHLIDVDGPREDYLLIVALRGEIEAYMRRGYTYQEAISEWFK